MSRLWSLKLRQWTRPSSIQPSGSKARTFDKTKDKRAPPLSRGVTLQTPKVCGASAIAPSGRESDDGGVGRSVAQHLPVARKKRQLLGSRLCDHHAVEGV